MLCPRKRLMYIDGSFAVRDMRNRWIAEESQVDALSVQTNFGAPLTALFIPPNSFKSALVVFLLRSVHRILRSRCTSKIRFSVVERIHRYVVCRYAVLVLQSKNDTMHKDQPLLAIYSNPSLCVNFAFYSHSAPLML